MAIHGQRRASMARSAARRLGGSRRAQQQPMPVAGFLGIASPDTYAPMAAAFRQGLAKAVMLKDRTSRSSTASPKIN
jgi:hypothetical protein